MSKQYTHGMDRKWFVGSEHGTAEQPDYRYDTDGWPFFIGVNETRLGRTDHHIATSIVAVEIAQEIVESHNQGKTFDSYGFLYDPIQTHT